MPQSSNTLHGSTGTFGVYRFTSPCHEAVIVLAANLIAAVSVLDRWRGASRIGEVQFTAEPNWGGQLSLSGRAHLHEAVQRCPRDSVLVRYRADAGWALMTMSSAGNDP